MTIRNRRKSNDGIGLPRCPPSDSSWRSVDVGDGTPVQVETDGQRVAFGVQHGDYRLLPDGGSEVVLRVEISVPVDRDDAYYVGASTFERLLVDGLSAGPPRCMNRYRGCW